MKKSLKLLLITLLLTAGGVIYAQTGSDNDGGSFFDSLFKWIAGIGIPGILAFIFGIWKNGVTLVGKVAGGLVRLLDAVGNLLVQVIEAKLAIRNELDKLKAYTADGKLEKVEIEQFIQGIEDSMDELNDIPVAIQNLKREFKDIIGGFKKK